MKEGKLQRTLRYILFIFQPWLAMISSLFKLKNKSSHTILILFSICYGLAFTVDLNSNYDSVSYYNNFVRVSLYSFDEFYTLLKNYFIGVPEKKDIYSDSVAFLVSRFTSNYHVLFGVYAFVFSFFAIKSLKYLTKLPDFKNRHGFSFMLVFVFLLSNPIFNINGVRFYTAAWVAVFFGLKIVVDKRKIYFLFLLLLPLIHGSFWVFIFLSIIFVLVKNEKILVISFFSSLIISEFTLFFLTDISSLLPSLLNRYVEVYTSEDIINKVENKSMSSSNITQFLKFLVRVFPNLLVFLIIKRKNSLKNWKQNSLFKFIIILISFSNLTMAIPSLGNRYLTLTFPFICIFWLTNCLNLKKYNWFVYLYPFMCFFELFLFYNRSLEVLDNYFYFFPLPIFLNYIL